MSKRLGYNPDVVAGARRFWHPCAFCGDQAVGRLLDGTYVGWLVCSKPACNHSGAAAPLQQRVARLAA